MVVACSGGPDSVALAWTLKDLENRIPFRFILAHVNHHWRGDLSNRDERFVASLADRWGWRSMRRGRRPRPRKGNLEESARIQRYDALTKMAGVAKAKVVLTAHTSDDQAETVFMNLLRGAGTVGSGGMPELRLWPGTRVWIARPFLSVSRHDVLKFLSSRKRDYRSDATNDNTRFLRNWVRHRVFPMLEKRAPGFRTRLGRFAAIMQDEQQFLDETVERLSRDLLRPFRGGRLLDFESLLSYSAAVQRRFLRRNLGHENLPYERVEGLRRWMNSSPTNGRIWQLKNGWIAERLSKTKGSPSSSMFWLGQPKKRFAHQNIVVNKKGFK